MGGFYMRDERGPREVAFAQVLRERQAARMLQQSRESANGPDWAKSPLERLGYGVASSTAEHVYAGYGEQCADTNGLAAALGGLGDAVGKYLVSDGNEEHCRHCGSVSHDASVCPSSVGELQARIARKEAANAALVAKLEAVMLDLRSTAKARDEYKAEAERLSALAQDLQAQLSARHGAAGEPQTGASIPCETPRAFRYGWATNWRMR